MSNFGTRTHCASEETNEVNTKSLEFERRVLRDECREKDVDLKDKHIGRERNSRIRRGKQVREVILPC